MARTSARNIAVAHHLHSSLREKIVEHVFVGDALRALWSRGVFDVEVLRSEFDVHGYDLVMQRGDVVRHVQFKTGVREKPVRVSVASALVYKPSGCVIWIQVDNNLQLVGFWWFGGRPTERLPSLGDRISKRIARTREGVRPNREGQRIVNGSRFSLIGGLDGLLDTLFGPLPVASAPGLTQEQLE